MATTQKRASVSSPTVAVARVSGSIADHLRREIIRGNLKEGDALPPESTLISDWGVSRATLREAFRVLETESLITVRRGAQGGARVTPPHPHVAARYVGHLLQYRGATIGDISRGAIVIQPPAVRLIAERQPAGAVSALHEYLEREDPVLDDPIAFGRRSLEFGRMLTDVCEDQLLQMFGEVLFYMRQSALDFVMLAQFQDTGIETSGRKAAHWVHARQVRLVELIEANEPRKAEQHWRSFLEQQLQAMPRAAEQLLYDAWPGDE